jgi:hypothetical protein
MKTEQNLETEQVCNFTTEFLKLLCITCYVPKITQQEAYMDRVYSNICNNIHGNTMNSSNLKY